MKKERNTSKARRKVSPSATHTSFARPRKRGVTQAPAQAPALAPTQTLRAHRGASTPPPAAHARLREIATGIAPRDPGIIFSSFLRDNSCGPTSASATSGGAAQRAAWLDLAPLHALDTKHFTTGDNRKQSRRATDRVRNDRNRARDAAARPEAPLRRTERSPIRGVVNAVRNRESLHARHARLRSE